MGSVYVGDVGTEILVDTGSDLATATTTDLLVRKPDGTDATWAGSVTETTKITYTAQAGDFDQSGIYTVQASVVLAAWSGLGASATFPVYKPFT